MSKKGFAETSQSVKSNNLSSTYDMKMITYAHSGTKIVVKTKF